MEEEKQEEYEAQTIGELLRNTRIKQGRELRDAAEVLCIRTSYLEAIENMDIKNIPPAPYGTGFVRSYADFLGLNGERILSSYRQAVYGVSDQAKKPQERKEETSGPKWRHILLGLICLAALAYAWTEFPFKQDNDTVTDFENTLEATPIPEPVIIDDTSESEPALQDAQQPESLSPDSGLKVEENELKTENTELKQPETTEQSQPEVLPARVKMVFTGPSWVELKRNGKVVLSRTMQRGREYVIEDAENSVVTVGRFKNVKFYINDKEVKVVTALRSRNVALKDFIKTENQE